ncbi:unnamed protein product [Prorocentrum cordatum]|uniref:Mycothiol-dependent maleylpyruvate isomerase metal-binding domain-containing protein n=1 Tax=Prorocentrum cordatum TaxID=2364126 RepID=A0ABN9WYZ6_9DINO|nr:unnamed protein product [Polarella glacialis]
MDAIRADVQQRVFAAARRWIDLDSAIGGEEAPARRVAGWQLEMAFGHVTFMALVRREVLSIFHSVYAFVAQSYRAFSALWPTGREGLENYLGLMVLLESRWTREWAPIVHSSDASLHSYGVAEACFEPATVAEMGRVSEL